MADGGKDPDFVEGVLAATTQHQHVSRGVSTPLTSKRIKAQGVGEEFLAQPHRSRGESLLMLTSLTAYAPPSDARSTFITEPYEPLPRAANTLKSFILGAGILSILAQHRWVSIPLQNARTPEELCWSESPDGKNWCNQQRRNPRHKLLKVRL